MHANNTLLDSTSAGAKVNWGKKKALRSGTQSRKQDWSYMKRDVMTRIIFFMSMKKVCKLW
jgi:hypothetical protein